MNPVERFLAEYRKMPFGYQIKAVYQEQWVIYLLFEEKVDQVYMHARRDDYNLIRLKELEAVNNYYPQLIDKFSDSLGICCDNNTWWLNIPCPDRYCGGTRLRIDQYEELFPNPNERLQMETVRYRANRILEGIENFNSSKQDNHPEFCFKCISDFTHSRDVKVSGEWIWFDTDSEQWYLRTEIDLQQFHFPLQLPAWASGQEIAARLDKMYFPRVNKIYNWQEDE